jgi:hypothetical protein
MPVFALFNAGVALGGNGDEGIGAVGLGAFLGLVVGKPVGVTAAAWLAMRLRLATLPEGTSWGAMLGVSSWPGSASPCRCLSPALPSETPRSWMRASAACSSHRSSPRSQVRPFSTGRRAGGRGSRLIQATLPESRHHRSCRSRTAARGSVREHPLQALPEGSSAGAEVRDQPGRTRRIQLTTERAAPPLPAAPSCGHPVARDTGWAARRMGH